MTRELLSTDIHFSLDEEALLKRLHCSEDDEIFARALELFETVRPLVRPSFAVREFPLDEVGEKGFSAGGRFFRSHIAAKKLKGETLASASGTFSFDALPAKEMPKFGR